jgi:hypothetical protein
MPDAEAMEEIALNPAVYIVAGCVAAALLLGLLSYLLFRFRKVKITVGSAGMNTVRASRPEFLAGLKRRLIAKLAALRFFLDALYFRNTPPGVLCSLERWGRRHQMPRMAGETHGSFLLRLAKRPPFCADEVPELLRRLSRDLDVRYYAGRDKRSSDALSPRDLRRIRSCLRAGAQKKDTEQ